MPMFNNAGNATFDFDANYTEDFSLAKAQQFGKELSSGVEFGIDPEKPGMNVNYPVIGLSVFRVKDPKIFPVIFTFEAAVSFPSGGQWIDSAKTATDIKVDFITVPRAAFLRPGRPQECYFFQGDQYIRMLVTPGSTNDQLLSGPTAIWQDWPSLRSAGFSTVDAALPKPNGEPEVYFFSGNQYCSIRVDPGTGDSGLIIPPASISGGWPALGKAGFTSVEEVFPSPRGGGETYFFKDTQYCRIKFDPTTNNNSLLTDATNIQAGWPSLKAAGFSSIDVAFINYKTPEQVYCFSGDKYARIKVVPGTDDDTLVDGPKNVADYWGPLRKAGFY